MNIKKRLQTSLELSKSLLYWSLSCFLYTGLCVIHKQCWQLSLVRSLLLNVKSVVMNKDREKQISVSWLFTPMFHIIIQSPAKIFLTSSGNPNSAPFQWLFSDLNRIYKSILSTSQHTCTIHTEQTDVGCLYSHTFSGSESELPGQPKLQTLACFFYHRGHWVQGVGSHALGCCANQPIQLVKHVLIRLKPDTSHLALYKWNENIGFGRWWKTWPSTASCGLKIDLTHPQSWLALTVL